MFKRTKYGFANFIIKTLPTTPPTPSLSILEYTPLTKKSFTDTNQLKKGMKLIIYYTKDGLPSNRRTKIWHRGKLEAVIGLNTIKIIRERDTYYVNFNKIFFYEEEKALGRVP